METLAPVTPMLAFLGFILSRGQCPHRAKVQFIWLYAFTRSKPA